MGTNGKIPRLCFTTVFIDTETNSVRLCPVTQYLSDKAPVGVQAHLIPKLFVYSTAAQRETQEFSVCDKREALSTGVSQISPSPPLPRPDLIMCTLGRNAILLPLKGVFLCPNADI